MAKFSYSPLSLEEIRVLDVHPGSFGDPIYVSLSHFALVLPPQQHSARLSLVELRKTLPPGWTAWENVEGRIYFENENNDSTCWQHPDANHIQDLVVGAEEVDHTNFPTEVRSAFLHLGIARENRHRLCATVCYPKNQHSTSTLDKTLLLLYDI
jgi:hypothetical protein